MSGNDAHTLHSCGQCVATFKSELTLDGLKFNENTGKDWQWQWGHDPSRCLKSWKSHFAYRVTIFAVWLGICVWSVLLELDSRWATYLTQWGAVIELLYLGMALYNTWLVRPSNANLPDTPPTSIKLAWYLNGIALPLAVAIAVNYWLLVYAPPLKPISAFTHGFNAFIILVDAVVCSHPYHLAQYCVVLPLVALYYVWTGIHLAADVGGKDGESYIYSVIDWEDNPGFTAALMCGMLFIGTPIFVCLVRVVFYVRGSTAVINQILPA